MLQGVQLGLPKGRMHDEIMKLFKEAGIKMTLGDREYRPKISLPGWSVKLLKPQNIVKMLHAGSRDVGFAGADWIANLSAEVVEVCDLELNPVRIVVASPDAEILDNPDPSRRLRVASEYEKVCNDWIADRKLNAELVRTFGATECFPPDDADMILDNTATGATLRANGLHIIETVMTSTTRLYASKQAWANPKKRVEIETLALLLQSALDARNLVVCEFNVSVEDYEAVLDHLPAMRSPTVAKLHGDLGFAVKICITRKISASLLPRLVKSGASDIIVYPITQTLANRPNSRSSSPTKAHRETKEVPVAPSSSTESSPPSLRIVTPAQVQAARVPTIDAKTMGQARDILSQLRVDGEEALLRLGTQFGDIKPGQAYVLNRDDLRKAFEALPRDQQELLRRTADRISSFARQQRDSVRDLDTDVVAGRAGHEVAPVEVAGCYAPGGRFPLPSSVLMTACTARSAGVKTVWVASPRPVAVTKAAAYVAGADAMLAIGGAQAIGAFAYGVGQVPRCDVIVGPGNRWVTAAKSLCVGQVRIDMLAGPSELLVFADSSADPETVAADLLAQAEHDTDARPYLVTTDPTLPAKVQSFIDARLAQLPASNRVNASAAVRNGMAVVVDDLDAGIAVCDELAGEHLELLLEPKSLEIARSKINHYGAMFIGSCSAEVFGDYGIGPNHTLPTGGTARYSGGLSVFNFLRVRTWLNLDSQAVASSQGQGVVNDAIALAKLEGLIGHAESAGRRLNSVTGLSSDSKSSSSNEVKSSTTPTSPASLIRPDFAAFMNYTPVKPLDVLAEELGIPVDQLVKLDANENLYGPHPDVIKAITDEAVLNIYPDPDQNRLRTALSAYTGVAFDQIVAGAGADENIELMFKILDPQAVFISKPTFSMYDFFGRIAKTPVIDVPRGAGPDFVLDVEGLVSAIQNQNSKANTAKLVFLTSPNNPTGGVVSEDELKRLLTCDPRVVVAVDEAYAEFQDNPAGIELFRKYQTDYPNLVILRTFSKFAGLAGLRVGYMIAHADYVKAVLQIKQPYNINVAADTAACYSLTDGLGLIMDRIKHIRIERERIFARLSDWPWLEPVPSKSNFVLCKVHQSNGNNFNAKELQLALRKRGVLVRCYYKADDAKNVLNHYIRVSASRPSDTDRFLSVMQDMFPLPVQISAPTTASCVVWDMDGVIADVSASYRQAIISTAKLFGATVTLEDIENLKAQGNANNDWIVTQRLITEKTGKNVSLDDVTAAFQQLYLGGQDGKYNQSSGLWKLESLLPPIHLFNALSDRKVPMSIVTGRPRYEAEFFLKQFNLSDKFQTLYCMEDGPAKPNPSGLLSVLSEMKLQASPSIWFIGDTPDDMVAAVAAGITGLGYTKSLRGDADTQRNLFKAGASRLLVDWSDFLSVLGLQQSSVTPSSSPSLPLSSSVSLESKASFTIKRTGRYGTISRNTKETQVHVEIQLDGTGKNHIDTGVGFYDHMLSAFSKHGHVDLILTCSGDLHIDDHHTVEDCALALGSAIQNAFASSGGVKGVNRFGTACVPLDEALARAVVDLSGRAFCRADLKLVRDNIGTMSSEMIAHAFTSLANNAKITLHVEVLYGENDHHRSEAAWKAFAVAFRTAVARSSNAQLQNVIPSTKGCL